MTHLSFNNFQINLKRDERNRLLKDIRNGYKDGVWTEFLEESADWFSVRLKYSQEFNFHYNSGVAEYFKKNWDRAYEHFHKANVHNKFIKFVDDYRR